MGNASKSDMDRKLIAKRMREHHTEVFRAHGVTPKGVDWGARKEDIVLRYDNMLAVIKSDDLGRRVRLLDVGCGYGGLLDRIIERGLDIEYEGIDIVEDMITEARKRHPSIRFDCLDIFEATDLGSYDYLVCNGILTQMLDIPIGKMDEFARALIKRMFDLSTEGIAFNMMSNRVNFMVPTLFYKSPVEVLNWCMTEVTPNVRLDHSYPLYEFMVYLNKNGVQR